MRSSFFLASVIAPLIGFTQVGTNATCATAIELEVAPGNVQQSLVTVDGRWFTGAVPSPITACSGGSNLFRSAWYRFTATATKHWIRTEGIDMDDASMEVFSGGCGNLTTVQCFAANGPTPALTGLTVGSTYHLRVGMTGTCSDLSPACQVYIGVVSAPVNDECPNAIELPVVSGALQAWPTREISTLGATQSAPACAGNAAASNDDVWYRFTATAGTHFLPNQRMTGAVQDNVFQWYSGSCGNLTSIGCDVDVVSGLAPGTSYYIRAYSESTDPAITLRAMADVLAPAPNDECAGALPLEVTAVGDVPKPVSFSTINTTSSTVPCETEPHDAWLRFTAAASSVVIVVQRGGSAALFSGSCGALSCVGQGSTLTDGYEFTGLTAGTEYFLKIGKATITRADQRIWAFAPANNADCATSIELDVQEDPVAFTHGHLYTSTEDAWYRFTATATQHLLEGYTTAGEAQLAIRATVFSGTCTSQTQVATSNDISVPLALTGLVIGQTYHVNMWATGEVAFRVAVRRGLLNDDCAGAIELPFSELEDVDSAPQISNAMATNGTGGCMPDKDLWYRFTAASSTVMFTTWREGANNSAIELYTGDCGALAPISCVEDMPRATFTALVPGTAYFIRWSSQYQAIMRPMLFDRPVNDEVAGALPAPTGSTFAPAAQQFRNYAATQTLPAVSPCAGGGPDDDMWFTFTATAATHTVSAVQQNLFTQEADPGSNFRVQVYDTLTTDLDVLAEHSVGCGISPVTLNGLVVGKQYLYRTYHSMVNTSCGFLTWVAHGNNDEAVGAHPLGYSDAYSALFNTTGATRSQPDADCQVDDHADDDIWFKFTATAAPARIVIGHATADVTIELFSGTPGNLTSLACDGNILDLPALTGGQTYFVRVYSWKNATPVQGRIGLLTTPSLTANGCVDEQCLGPVLVPNPGIEQGAHCLVHTANVGGTEGLGTLVAPGWPRMQLGSSDGWSSCTGYDQRHENPGTPGGLGYAEVLSRSGKGMGGLLMADNGGAFEYVEYLQAPLSEALVPGEAYLISFYAANNPLGLCLSGLGAKLSEGSMPWATYFEPIPVTPDVVSTEAICGVQWTNICAIVVPTTAVDHITIGPFQMKGEAVKIGNPNASSYYVIDDVVVSRIDDPSCITSIGDVPPLDEEANGQGDDLRVYPNPANDRVNIVCGAGLFGERAVIEVFDITGKRVHAEEVSHLQVLQPLELAADWKEGLYLVMVRVPGQAPKSERVVLRR